MVAANSDIPDTGHNGDGPGYVPDAATSGASSNLEHLYSAIIESSDDAIIAKQLDGVIIAWNPGAERLYGFTAQEAIGSNIEIIVPEDRRDEVWTIIERIRNGERVHHFETVRMHKNGLLINVSLTVSPVWSPNGQVSCVSVIARDITEQKNNDHIFRMVVEASPNGLIMVDNAGRIVLVNSEAERQFGYTREELLGNSVDILVPDLLRATHSEHRAGFTANSAARMMGSGRELHGLRKDGSSFPVEIGLNPIQGADGMRVLSAIVDISKRVQTERAMRETEQKLSTIVDLLPVGVAILDSQRKMIYSNPALTNIVDLPPSDADIDDHIRRHYIRGDGAPMAQNEFASSRALREQKTVYDVETGIIKEDGSLTWTNVSAVPVHFSDWRVVIVTTDMTERKNAQDKLLFQACLLENISDAIIATNLNGLITNWNAAAEELYGWKSSEILGLTVAEILQPEYVGTTPEQVQIELEQKGSWKGEVVHYRNDGAPLNILSSLAQLKDASGKIIGAVLVNRDITERKRTEMALLAQTQELQRSNAELEQFAYIASHDLQEPLRMVASYTELLRERYSGQLDARADKFINYAVDGARRMQQLVNDLLSYSRIGTQGKAFAPTDTDFVLKRVLASIALKIHETNAQIAYGTLPVVLADPIQIGQLFQNLIGNAIKFRGNDIPKIIINAHKIDRTMWQFSVTDNGIGIDTEYAQRVFQIFQRLHERTSYPGSGIGLAIAKKIVERHGGRIWFESEAGHGATFFFTLPGAKENEQ